MNDPTPLTPAAQAVLDAIKSELDHAPWELSFIAGPSAAAALRAAADQLIPYSVEEMPGAAFCRNKLLTIAAELEK